MIRIKQQYESFNRTERMVLWLALLLLLIPMLIGILNIQFAPFLFGMSDHLFLSRVGEFNKIRLDVKRKVVDNRLFEKSRPRDAVYMGDSVLTEEDSTSIVYLDDGSVIRVMPNSLVRIIMVEKLTFSGFKRVFRVNMDHGGLQVITQGTSLEVKLPSGKVEQYFSNAVQSVAPKRSQQMDPLVPLNQEIPEEILAKIPVIGDPMTLQPTPTVAVKATSTPTATVSTSEKNSIVGHQVRLKHPLENQQVPRQVIRGKEHSILFTWVDAPECVRYEWQYSVDESFVQIQKTRTIRDNFISHNEPRSGQFYWRVVCIESVSDENGIPKETRTPSATRGFSR
jgi:hypothetical protein